MSNESPDSESRRDAFIALVLLAVSVILLSISIIVVSISYSNQLNSDSNQSHSYMNSFINLLNWQRSVSSEQQTKLEDAIERQRPLVAQSQQVQDSLKKLATDLLDAAQTDDTARAIASKYIQKNGVVAPAGN